MLEKIAARWAAVASARATYLDAARRRELGRPYSEQASVAKLVATDAAMKVTTDAVQVFGGVGYTRDYRVERYIRDEGIVSTRNANPRVDEAHHRVSPAGFKYYVIELACQAAGGPQQYSGRSMGDSHRHLEITEEEWAAFMDDLQQTMNSFDVPPPEQEELKAIIESTHDAIVVSPLQSATP